MNSNNNFEKPAVKDTQKPKRAIKTVVTEKTGNGMNTLKSRFQARL